MNWTPLQLTVKNLMYYGKDKTYTFDFSNINGITGINVLDNNQGKTSLIDILLFAVYGRSFRLDKIGVEHFVSKFAKNPGDNFAEIIFSQNNQTYKIIRKIDLNSMSQSVEYFKLSDDNYVSVSGIRGLCPYDTAIKTSIIFDNQYSLLGGSYNDLIKNLHHIFNNNEFYDYNNLTEFFKNVSTEINKWFNITNFTIDLEFLVPKKKKENLDVEIKCLITRDNKTHEEFYPQDNNLINCIIRLALFNKCFNNYKSWMIFDYSYLAFLGNTNKQIIKQIMDNIDNISFVGILDGEHNKKMFCNSFMDVIIS